MKIRKYEPPDEQAVVALWQECGLTRPWNYPRRDIARKLTVQPELFLVGTFEGPVISTAMVGFDGHRGWLLMANHSARRIGVLFLFICAGNSNAQHGLSPELSATIIISGKTVCDRTIPGYKERTDSVYARWKLQNAEIISRAVKYRYAGKTFDDFIRTNGEQLLGLPKDDRQKACDEITGQLELPLR